MKIKELREQLAKLSDDTTVVVYWEDGAKRAAWGSLMDDIAAADPDADFKRNMPQEVGSDLGKPFTRLVVDSYLNSFTSLSDVSRYLGLRAGQVAFMVRNPQAVDARSQMPLLSLSDRELADVAAYVEALK